jgi:hypothetical protein
MTYVIQDPDQRIKYDRVVPQTDEQRAMVEGYETRRLHRKENRQRQKTIVAAITKQKPWLA